MFCFLNNSKACISVPLFELAPFWTDILESLYERRAAHHFHHFLFKIVLRSYDGYVSILSFFSLTPSDSYALTIYISGEIRRTTILSLEKKPSINLVIRELLRTTGTAASLTTSDTTSMPLSAIWTSNTFVAKATALSLVTVFLVGSRRRKLTTAIRAWSGSPLAR